MEKRFSVRQLLKLMCLGGIIGMSSQTFAAGFQLFEQDGASVGDYHAGRAAQANDATTVFYNPAGIIRLKNQQIVIGDVGVFSDLKYRGDTTIDAKIANFPPQYANKWTGVVAQGGAFSQIPNFYYAAPINDKFGVGLSLNVPFGLRTDYGRDSALRYTATKSEIQVVDLSPAFAFKVYQGLSIGAGMDIERMGAEFDQMAYFGGNQYDNLFLMADLRERRL